MPTSLLTPKLPFAQSVLRSQVVAASLQDHNYPYLLEAKDWTGGLNV
jgi:hypothetical protein